MEIPLLRDILIVLGLSTAILILASRIHLPPIVGLLITGVIAGPHGFGLLQAVHEVETMAEIGVVLLLFTIGMEFSLGKLFLIRRIAFVGGMLQITLTTAATWLICRIAGLPDAPSIFIGFLVSLSSTAIVLKALQERVEIETPHGRMALGILIFQDIAIVPMILLTPFLAGTGEFELATIGEVVAKILGVLLFLWLGTMYIVPWILDQVARTRSRELFVLCVVSICFAIAWMTASVGLSLGLGAFLAGLMLAESHYSHHSIGGILPFRDVFTSIFFVSIGMLLDIDYLASNPLVIAAAVVCTLALKGVVVGATGLLLKFPVRNAVHSGVILSQVGEFSFVLARAGVAAGLIGGGLYQTFLATSVITMALTPFLLGSAPTVARLAQQRVRPRIGSVDRPEAQMELQEQVDLSDHIVIIGFGFAGHNVARAAGYAGLPYVIIESNVETVRTEKLKGEPIQYGDATYGAVLDHAGIARARIVAVVINDPIATRHIVQAARSMNPTAHVIARTRFTREIPLLRELGATEIIPEEFETSVEISTRILSRYLVSPDRIAQFIDQIRSDHYGMYRSTAAQVASIDDLTWDHPEMNIFVVDVRGGSRLDGLTLAEANLRRRYGVTILEIRRSGDRMTNPAGDVRLVAGDELVLIGDSGGRRDVIRMGAETGMHPQPGADSSNET